MIVEQRQTGEMICPILTSVAIVHCVGRRCMAWRWARYPNDNTVERTEDAEGYCGLAGKP